MTTSTYTIRPSARATGLSFLVHHNPFYLLSALCMIAGCYALNSSMALYSGDLRGLLVLIGTINAYELLLIGLGLFLIRRRGIIRDGRTLLLLQCVFLFDLTFLNAETATGSLRAGLVVNSALLVIALLKVAAILRALSLRFPIRLFSAVALEIVALFAIPVLFKFLDRDASIAGRHFYAIWWLVGMLPVFIELQRRLAVAGTTAALPDAAGVDGPRPRLGGVYLVTAWCAIVAHMGMMHWVYQVDFSPADLSPVLLGLAVLAGRETSPGFVRVGEFRSLRWVLPVAALALSFFSAPELGLATGRSGRLHISAPLLTAGGAYLAYVYLYFLPWAAYFIAAAIAAGLIVLFGPTWTQAQITATAELRTTTTVGRWLLDTGYRLVPKTALQWGLTAVGASFAFLGIGAAVSLSQGRPPGEEGTPR
jgi:hypothetical protein